MNAEAKFVKTKPGVKHIAYIHAPTHYYWDRYEQYLRHPGFGAFVAEFARVLKTQDESKAVRLLHLLGRR